ncbi:hypothetical protein OTK01_000337 [Caldicellulosiruptor acetigenus]|uniref:hypothetical protein n=1 Tax=Caldicellulosiruptor acetigenus TaxID=301953 RepID=UPI0022A8ED34|nr:hypothetical protein [Caldicellulosiruptor acetigenus]WAM36563.1 hypothetical protein OTK01_000337 [Caldicellulosiruptor acetigenus]
MSELAREIAREIKEVKDAFLDTLQELFNPKYPVQKLGWKQVWKTVNSKLPDDNSYRNRYGKGKPYPDKDVIKLIEARFDGKTLELARHRVLFSIVRTPDGFVECYKLFQQFERTPAKEAIEAIERALDTDLGSINDMFVKMYAY